MSDIVDRDGPDRRLQMCRCHVCGIVARCTPRFDFYGKDGAPLRCEGCFRESLAAEGVRYFDMTQEPVKA